VFALRNEAKDTEINTIKNILRNNEYNIKAISKSPPSERGKTKYTS
jgi:hypothetical protein